MLLTGPCVEPEVGLAHRPVEPRLGKDLANALCTPRRQVVVAWFHWPRKAISVRFAEVCMVIVRTWEAPTFVNSRYFECGVPPRPRQEPRQVRAKLHLVAVSG